MLKHGLITDESHWGDLISIKELTPQNIFPFIEKSMQIKQNVVEQDFTEQNVRKTLNFGHTIGHALESLFLLKGKPIMHGEAVALGMICETRISFLQDLISEETANEIVSNIQKYYPHLDISEFSVEEIVNLMKNDKKNSAGNINFSLITGIGSSTFNCSVSLEDIENSLLYYQNLA